MGNTLPHLFGSDLLSFAELDERTVLSLFETAAAMKKDYTPFSKSMAGHSAILLFEKPSLRTRISFEVGIAKLESKQRSIDPHLGGVA